MSNGRYKEFHYTERYLRIGKVTFDTETREIVSLNTPDTSKTLRLSPEIMSRWLSPDPLAAKYPSLNPYNFGGNNPIYYIDPDGGQIVPVNDVSGYRTEEIIASTFSGKGMRKLRKLFKYNSKSGKFNEIDIDKFKSAVKKLDSDELIVAATYLYAVNSENIHKVELTKNTEALVSPYLLSKARDYNKDGIVTGQEAIESVKLTAARSFLTGDYSDDRKKYTPHTIGFIAIEAEIPADYIQKNGITESEIVSLEEKLLHEVFAHGVVDFIKTANLDEKVKAHHKIPIQLGNIYRRMIGIESYRSGEDHDGIKGSNIMDENEAYQTPVFIQDFLDKINSSDEKNKTN